MKNTNDERQMDRWCKGHRGWLSHAIEFEGVLYPSQKKLFETIKERDGDKVAVSSDIVLSARLKRGMSIEDALYKKNVRSSSYARKVEGGIEYEGVRYESYYDLYVAAKKNHPEKEIRQYETYKQRMKSGYSPEDSLFAPLMKQPKEWTYNGKVYSSIYELYYECVPNMKAVSLSAVKTRLKAGWDVDVALRTPCCSYLKRQILGK